MLRLAHVGPGDTLLDLGCGDGRILLAAVRVRNWGWTNAVGCGA
jgi:cyclopropane fatty-acyl-phospholipid synthase-like methyltransferase